MADNATNDPVTVVFNWRVKPGNEKIFEELMHDIHKVARTFPGHEGVTTIKSPAHPGEFKTVLRFDSVAHLDRWLDSDVRKKMLEPLKKIAHEETYTASGLETWFDIPGQAVKPPPRWKMVIATFIAIYPISLVYGLFVVPHTAGWPIAARSLLLPIAAPIILTYAFMPFITQRVLKRWLYRPGNTK